MVCALLDQFSPKAWSRAFVCFHSNLSTKFDVNAYEIFLIIPLSQDRETWKKIIAIEIWKRSQFQELKSLTSAIIKNISLTASNKYSPAYVGCSKRCPYMHQKFLLSLLPLGPNSTIKFKYGTSITTLFASSALNSVIFFRIPSNCAESKKSIPV